MRPPMWLLALALLIGVVVAVGLRACGVEP
jgi:hypothetical protein